jgi:hypothetical protein
MNTEDNIDTSWHGAWLSFRRQHTDTVKARLESIGLKENEDFRLYQPAWRSIVDGKAYRYHDRALVLFMGGGGNEIFAKMVF